MGARVCRSKTTRRVSFPTNEARRLSFFGTPTIPFIFHQSSGVQMYIVITTVEKDSLEKCPIYKCNSWIDIVEKNEPEWRNRLPRCPCKANRIFEEGSYTIEPAIDDPIIDWTADRTCESPVLLSCEEEHDRHKGLTFGCLEWKGDIGLPFPYTFYEGVQECCYDSSFNLIPYGDNRAGVTALDGMGSFTGTLALAAGGFVGGLAASRVSPTVLPFQIAAGAKVGYDLVKSVLPPGYDFSAPNSITNVAETHLIHRVLRHVIATRALKMALVVPVAMANNA